MILKFQNLNCPWNKNKAHYLPVLSNACFDFTLRDQSLFTSWGGQGQMDFHMIFFAAYSVCGDAYSLTLKNISMPTLDPVPSPPPKVINNDWSLSAREVKTIGSSFKQVGAFWFPSARRVCKPSEQMVIDDLWIFFFPLEHHRWERKKAGVVLLKVFFLQNCTTFSIGFTSVLLLVLLQLFLQGT